MRKSLLSLLVVAVLGVFAAQALAATRTVKLGDDWFVSKSGSHSVTVRKGARVVWRNTGSVHNVAVKKGPVKFRSGYLTHGRTFAKTLRRAGTYKIVCTIHSGMTMTLHVKG